jgi:hypothetical protein
MACKALCGVYGLLERVNNIESHALKYRIRGFIGLQVNDDTLDSLQDRLDRGRRRLGLYFDFSASQTKLQFTLN